MDINSPEDKNDKLRLPLLPLPLPIKEAKLEAEAILNLAEANALARIHPLAAQLTKPTNEGVPSPHPFLPVGGRLQHYMDGWDNFTDDLYIRRLIAEGYKLPFRQFPPLTLNPREVAPPVNARSRAAIAEQVNLLVLKHATTIIEPGTPGFYSHVFVVPKSSGKWRLIIDLKRLNDYVECPHFKMTTVSQVLDSLAINDWAFKLDLEDAYFHVPIHPSSRKYLRFIHENKIYQFRALPFGLNTAPLIFTRLVHTLTAYLHTRGVSVLPYLDDWIVHHQNPNQLLQQQQLVLSVLEQSGFKVNTTKSELIPTQDIQFLGIRFQLKLGRVSIPPRSNLPNPWDLITPGFARHLPRPDQSSVTLTYKQVTSLLGSLNWVAPISSPWDDSASDPYNFCSNNWASYNGRPPITEVPSSQLTPILLPWLDQDFLSSGISMEQFRPDIMLFTDASTHGWGAHMFDMELSGSWTPEEASLHINCLELLAVSKALHSWLAHVQNNRILVATDNTTVVAHINKQGGTHSRSLFNLTQDLLLWLHEHNVQLRARHIPGRFNAIADRLSRSHQVLNTEWQINSMILFRIFNHWGTPTVDMFATPHNAQLPQFVSPVPHPRALAVDALSQPWDNRWMYMFPPFPILSQVLRKLRNSPQSEAILIAPLWPSRPWFPQLLHLCVDIPLVLPRQPDLLTQPGPHFHNGDRFHLHAWKLSCNTSKQKDFLRRSPDWQPLLAELPPTSSTTADGNASQNGLRKMDSIHTIPLPPL